MQLFEISRRIEKTYGQTDRQTNRLTELITIYQAVGGSKME